MGSASTSSDLGYRARRTHCLSHHKFESGPSLAILRRRGLAVLAGLLLASVSSHALAQQINANGTAQTASGTIDTGAAAPPAGYTLWALNGGIINGTSGLILLNNTAGVPIVVRAESGGQITLVDGTTATAGPASSNVSPGTVLSADGPGSVITATNTALIAQGNSTYGATAGNGGTIILTGGTIDTFGTFAVGHGLNALVGGTITSTGQTITTTGFGGYAAGGVITIQDATITERLATGNVAGLRSDLPSGLITATRVNITQSGANSFGVVTTDGGTLRINDSTINTSGDGGHALNSSQSNLATGTRSLVEATNVNVVTSGVSGFGALAYNGGLMNLTNVDIQTSGDFAYGIDVLGFNTAPPSGPPISTVLNGTNVTIHATGDSAYGAITEAAGTMNLTDSLVSATGPTAGGVFVGDSGSTGTLLRTPVTSAQYDGGRAADSGHLFITDSDVTAGRYGIRANGGTAADPSIVVFSGGTLTSASDAFNAHDTFSQITLMNGTAVTQGSGNLLNVISNDPATLISNVQFTTANIVATGNIIADATSIANIAITQNSTITGIELNTFTTLDASSTWIMNGNSDIYLLNNAGLVQYTPPVGDPSLLASYKTLTTNDYVGQGGTLGLNTYLGDDSAPSDRLVIDGGTATGNSFLAIANTTGPGALTLADGILVVDAQNGATTVPGAFALGNRVAAGAFEYGLYRSGQSDAEDWFLRSTIIPTPGPEPVPEPIPDYRNEVPVDVVLPALANRLGLGTLGTYHDRIGDDYPAPVQPVEPIICKAPSKDGGCAVPAAVAAEMQPERAAWGRLFGETGSVDFDATNPAGAVQNFVEHGPSYDFDMYGLQAGMDLLRRLNDDGSRDIAGFYIGVGRITADVDAVLGGPAGTSSVNGYSLGGYWTRIAEKGWYVDAVLQATWYDAEGNAEGRGRFAGENFDTDGWGFAASLEGGYPFDLGNGWSVEPQAQLVYQHVSLDDGSDAFARIDYDVTDALYGRLGGRLTKDWLTESGRRMTAWGKADVWSGFGASATTTFSGPAGGNPVSFDTDIGGTWGSVGLGLQGEVKKNVTMFASGDYNFGLGGDGDFDSWSGRIGMKVKW